jgi:hypothetical protein
MTQYNRFSVQILGTVDATSTEELLKAINSALGSIAKFNVKAVSHDKWTDGYTGKDRFFDEDGKEVVETPEVPVVPTPGSPAVANPVDENEVEVEEVPV